MSSFNWGDLGWGTGSCCGDIEGVEKSTIDCNSSRSCPRRSTTLSYKESLSSIATKYYGSANQCMAIFEANQPMLKDPNKLSRSTAAHSAVVVGSVTS
jgi:hypothetical protein